MSKVVVLAIPNSELPPAPPKLLAYLNESPESLRCLAIKLLGNRCDSQPLVDLFFDRVLCDEGIAYSDTVTQLHQQYFDYMNALDQVLYQYIGQYLSECNLKVVAQANAVIVVECHHDPLDPHEPSVGGLQPRRASPARE